MKLIRVIEEFDNLDDSLNKEFILDITPQKILEILEDFTLNSDDNPNEIFDSYPINKNQLEKLKQFLNLNFKSDYSNYSYFISCYEDN